MQTHTDTEGKKSLKILAFVSSPAIKAQMLTVPLEFGLFFLPIIIYASIYCSLVMPFPFHIVRCYLLWVWIFLKSNNCVYHTCIFLSTFSKCIQLSNSALNANCFLAYWLLVLLHFFSKKNLFSSRCSIFFVSIQKIFFQEVYFLSIS